MEGTLRENINILLEDPVVKHSVLTLRAILGNLL